MCQMTHSQMCRMTNFTLQAEHIYCFDKRQYDKAERKMTNIKRHV